MAHAPNVGLDLYHQGHRTRLKWHRLRCRLADPLFSAETMAKGFQVGASMELDLRVRADGGFVVLHDADLQGETTGHGPVREANAETIRSARMLSGGTAPILSEDLAHMLKSAHPEARLQFDVKDTLATIGDKGLSHLRDYFANAGRSIIISGGDLDFIAHLANTMPDIRRGIDPTDKLRDLLDAEGPRMVEETLIADINGPTQPDMVYLSWPLILKANELGLDLIAVCHAESKLVDAWTFNLADPEAGFSDVEWQRFSALMALKPDQVTTDEAPATERAWLKRISP
ncbi:glycerophosphodiester phosphodiesterase [Rhizobium oryzicola]|uniref:Glycerophosphodiester phosphodiesterase family protein n=1 Tax=Rhizobium oryzicola TaxID=1232668 RepID=A0ABT8SUH1_9HYPH|nr:glycerophosphodiester phosphodiesterase family protein [Rhizobium oryzicola]MDO1582089.1 glycerophosphodiester phosphodiesterase family protein [Rhizobium oryzicola]